MLTITYSVDGGGCGIRTHVTLLSNGFQDRLVMTASITLRMDIVSVGQGAPGSALRDALLPPDPFLGILDCIIFPGICQGICKNVSKEKGRPCSFGLPFPLRSLSLRAPQFFFTTHSAVL